MTRRRAALLVDALAAGYGVYRARYGETIVKLVDDRRRAKGLLLCEDMTAFIMGCGPEIPVRTGCYEVMRQALGIQQRGRGAMATTGNPIAVGDVVHYWSSRGGSENLVRGVVAERAPSPLGTGDRIRVVDSAAEMSDPEAGRWIAATDPIWAGDATVEV
jgi:hypothetical protein